ncbi:MAG: LysR family transcriptional regulator [Myxococcota bacterium]
MDDLLAELPTLVHVARTGSISRTARELGVPRSTVGRRIARIEAALGFPVAERTTRHLRLTPAGRMLVEGAGRLLGELRSLREQVAAQAGEVRGTVRVATPPGFAGPFLVPFLREFQAAFPGVEVDLVVTERHPHLLDEGFDVALATGALPDAPWIRHPLGESATLAVAAPGWLAAHGTPTSADDLVRHVLLSPRIEGLPTSTWPRRSGPPVVVAPRLVSNDLGTLRGAALAGMGVGLFPVHVVMEDLAAGTLTPVLADEIGGRLPIWALFTPERRGSPVIRALLDRASAFAASQTPARW